MKVTRQGTGVSAGSPVDIVSVAGFVGVQQSLTISKEFTHIDYGG